MNLSRHSPAPTRYVGLGLVAVLHLAGLYALSAGLVKAPPAPREPTTLKPLAPELTPPPIERPLPAPPRLELPRLIPVPPPDVVVEPTREPSPLATTTLRTDNPVAGPQGPQAPAARVDAPPATVATPALSSAGAVCSVMPRPEVPVVSWSGEAVLNAVATVRGGRVVGAELRVTQGALDSKTRRSLQRAVESALAGYQCQGDAVFQQDFAFRID
jgi:hypothetical protein